MAFLSRLFRICLCLGLAVFLIIGVIRVWPWAEPVPSEEELVARALNSLETAHSYRYTLRAVSIIDQRENLLTDLEGIWNRPDRFHLKGETLSTPLEAFVFGDEYIIRDPQGKWMEFQGEPSLMQEIVHFSEGPLKDLENLYSVQLIDEQVLAGQRCYVLEGRLSYVSNPLWQAFWQEFRCRLWIDKQELRLRRLDLNGKSRASDDRLRVEIEINDYDANLVIERPNVARNN